MAEMNSFRHLKEALFQATVLALPRSYLTYVLDTYGYDTKLGAVLMQRYPTKSL